MACTLESAVHDLTFAWGGPAVSGRLRTCPEDFCVRELPLVEPTGEGEHVCLLIRKRQENTDAVARLLAQHAAVPQRNVSYAGLKDRHALTEQWFSVHLPGKREPDWSELESATITLIRHLRHSRKLRRGALKGNAFRIRLRQVEGDRPVLEQRLEQVAAAGVPNYFGEQRFGRGGSNLRTADRLFSHLAGRLSRHQRGLALSAARSFLFNQVLDHRVREQTWNRAIPGEALQLDGSHSYFVAGTIDQELERRIEAQDVHPTGPLAGRGEVPVKGDCLRLEETCLAPFETWRHGLDAAGLRHERRALRLIIDELVWSWVEPGCLELNFSLPAGAYATSVLRELVNRVLW